MNANTNWDNCGACHGIQKQTPVSIVNSAGLDALTYRIGTYSKFKTSMLDSLPTYLPKLTTRSSSNDLILSLLDAWAVVLDILSFYQERIANEGFLRTATERMSVLEMARSIGYELSPGVASSTFLKFIIENSPGTIKKSTIDIGTKVQSLPKEGKNPPEIPQIFETIETIDAYPDLNGLSPLLITNPFNFNGANCSDAIKKLSSLVLNGTNTRLQAGDCLLIAQISPLEQSQDNSVKITPVAFKTISNVTIDGSVQQTTVSFIQNSPNIDNCSTCKIGNQSQVKKETLDIKLITKINKSFVTHLINSELDYPKLNAKIIENGWNLEDFFNIVNSLYINHQPKKEIKVYAFRVKSGIFGSNAQPYDTLPPQLTTTAYPTSWEKIPINENSNGIVYEDGSIIYLDNNYPSILPSTDDNCSWIVIQSKASDTQNTNFVKVMFEGIATATGTITYTCPSSNESQPPTPSSIIINGTVTATGKIVVSSTGTIVVNTLNQSTIRGNGTIDNKNGCTITGKGVITALVDKCKITITNSDTTTQNHNFCNITAVYTIKEVGQENMADFMFSNRVTRLSLNIPTGIDLSLFELRKTSVYVQSEELDVPSLVQDTCINYSDSISFDHLVYGLYIGQYIVIQGQVNGDNLNKSGSYASEIVKITNITALIDPNTEIPITKIVFYPPLINNYHCKTITVNANIVQATHGETKNEVLGGGDPSLSYLEFILKQKPLTFIPGSNTTGGASSTLQISVNDIKWNETSSLYGIQQNDRSFITRIEDDGQTRVIFGNSRPDKGTENIKAKYRVGIGTEGLLDADQLTLLMTRPLGVRGVTNPVPAVGAADQENLSQAKTNAPLHILTLDKIVSLKDFENFALTFAGVGKAIAIPYYDGGARGISLIVAGISGTSIMSSITYTKLSDAINNNKDPEVQVTIKDFKQKLFNVHGMLIIMNDRDPNIVKENVIRTLREKYSFESRQFGQPITKVEVIKIMQDVDGVVAADVLYLSLSTDDKSDKDDTISSDISDILTLNPSPDAITLDVIMR